MHNRAIDVSMVVVFQVLVGCFAADSIFGDRSANAQIIPDASLGNETSQINSDVNRLAADRIDGGATRGVNLFHSFREFNIGENQRVYFTNPSGIENILTRVTGGKVSNILGTLGVYGNANLFLINPGGIVFGENARLDIGGSFVGSTANAVKFGENGFFSATSAQTPSQLLTVNPSAFFFNQLQAGKIENRSIEPVGDDLFGLRVPDGRSLLLVGGNILMDGGRLNAPSGHVELLGVADRGTVGLNVDGNNLSAIAPDSLTRGDVSFTNGARIDVRGVGGGFVKVNSQNLELSKRSIIFAGIRSRTGTPSTQAGDVEINVVEQFNLDRSFIINIVDTDAIGTGGNVDVTTGNMTVSNLGVIETSSYGQGNAGNLLIRAKNDVVLDGALLFSFIASRELVGNSGDINIFSNSLQINNAILDSKTFGQGNGGNILLFASNSIYIAEAIIRSGIGSRAVGDGGDINIRAASLSVEDGAQLVSAIFNNTETSTLFAGRGEAGDININVTGAVSIVGVKRAPSGLFSLVSIGGVGNGGNINISADSFSLLDGANLFSNSNGEGNAGTIKINTNDFVTISGTSPTRGDSSEISARTNSFQDGGDIIIDTRNFNLSNGGVLNAQTVNNGNGGNIIVNGRQVKVKDGGQIITNTSGRGNAGKITVNASNEVIIDGIDTTLNNRIVQFGANRRARFGTSRGITNTFENGASGFFVSSQGLGGAGDIEVISPKVQLENQGRLIADSNSGNGGNITIDIGKLFLLGRDGLISTSAGTERTGGNGGNITINSPLIVAFPQQNSDITANAFSGNGGRVDIATQGVFGLVPRSRAELQALLATNDPTQLSPNRLPSNDITAISQENPSLDGQISINGPDIDPTRGLSELPVNVVDATRLINQNLCTAAQRGSEFIVTGRGGLPTSPADILNSHSTWEDWGIEAEPGTSVSMRRKPHNLDKQSHSSKPIVEAQGWTLDRKGNVVLTAKPVKVTPNGSWLHPLDCEWLRTNS